MDVVFPVQMRYPNVGAQVTELLRNLEDKYTSALDDEKFTEDDIEKNHQDIASNRAVLLTTLYAPLQSKFLFFKMKGAIRN